MAAIHSRDTKPERLVRRYLWAHGYRYRLNHPRLPGKPDIVLLRYRTCIFINGCFWHGHQQCKKYKLPKTRTPFWLAKVQRNQARDIRVQQQLATMGWHCITVWECELSSQKRAATLQSLAYTLDSIYLADHTIRPYQIVDAPTSLAGEDSNVDYSVSNPSLDIVD